MKFDDNTMFEWQRYSQDSVGGCGCMLHTAAVGGHGMQHEEAYALCHRSSEADFQRTESCISAPNLLNNNYLFSEE